MNNADLPAMPMSAESAQRADEGYYDQFARGLTKREHFAGLAMQAMIATGKGDHPEYIASSSFIYADALLAQSEKQG